MSLLFNMLSRFVIAFLPRSKHLLISWLQSPSAIILEHKKIKFVILSLVSPSVFHEVMGADAMILVFWMLSFRTAFSLSSFTFIMRLFHSSLLSAIRVVSGFQSVLHQPGISHDVLRCKLHKQGDNQYTALMYSFPNLEPSTVPYQCLAGASWPTYRFRSRQGKVVWYSHLLKTLPQFLWSTQSKALA